MIRFDKYKDYSKTLLIRFRCTRCGFEALEELEVCCGRTGEHGGYLHQLSLPKDWIYEDFKGYALCPKCRIEFDKFMRGIKNK